MLIRSSITIFMMLMFFPSQAYAYLDPGAGSMILQIILGGIAGLAVFGRLFWKKLKSGLFTKDKNPAEPNT